MKRALTSALIALVLPGMGGLLSPDAQARDLRADEPDRLALVSWVRTQNALGDLNDQTGQGWSIRRVWSDHDQATVCAVAVDRRGVPQLRQGRMLLSRVHMSRTDAGWRVQDQEQLWMPTSTAMRTQCQPKASAAFMLAALDELERTPPTAGPTAGAPQGWAPATPERTGRITARGRTLLHALPDLSSRLGKHLVQGDRVMIEDQRPGWTQVRYTHPITKVVTVGWVRSPRVAQTSTSTSLP